MEIGTSQTTKLEPFLILAKSMKGAGAAKLVQDATSAPGVYVFSELLEMNNVQELRNSEQHKGYYDLLELFAYRTYQDYLQHKDAFPPLNKAQIVKLKHLSIVSMAAERRIIPYSDLLTALSMPSIRELEDLIIDAMYLSLLTATLSHSSSSLSISYTMGRDAHPSSIPTLLLSLQSWADTTGSVLGVLDEKIQEMGEGREREKARVEDREARVVNLAKEIMAEKKDGKGVRRVRTDGSGRFEEVSNVRGSENMMDVDVEMGTDAAKGKNRKAPFFDIGSKDKRKRGKY